MRRYHCFDSLTVAHQSRSATHLASAPPSLRKRSPVSGRPCTTLFGWYRNQWDAPLGALGVKANCELFDDATWISWGARVVYHNYGLYRYYITPSLPSICCVRLPVFPFLIAGFVLVEWRSYRTAPLFLLFYHVSAKGSRESSWRLRTYTCVSVTSLDDVVHILNLSHSEAF